MFVKATSRPNQVRQCQQGIPIKASYRMNRVRWSQQGMSIKALSRPNRVRRCRQGMPIKASSRPNRCFGGANRISLKINASLKSSQPKIFFREKRSGEERVCSFYFLSCSIPSFAYKPGRYEFLSFCC